jgi:hypothetical protein
VAGIYFDTDQHFTIDPTPMLTRRGVTESTQRNDQGYFLSYYTEPCQQVGVGEHSTVLLDGLPWIEDSLISAQWMADNIDSKNTAISVIKCLRAASSPFIICTVDEWVIFTCGHLSTKPSFYALIEETGKLGICSDPTVLQAAYGRYTRLLCNIIYLFNRKTKVLTVTSYYDYDINQTVDSWDELYDNWQHTIRMTNKFKPIYMLSSGMDSGCYVAEACAQDSSIHVCHVHFNKTQEDYKTVGQRLVLHPAECRTVIPFSSYNEESCPINQEVLNYKWLIGVSHYEPINHVKQLKTMLPSVTNVVIGNIADWLLDHGWDGKRTRSFSRTGGWWPSNLEVIWPLMVSESQNSLYTLYAAIWGAYGIETHTPYANLDVLQSFYRTTARLKNSRYKSWIADRLDYFKYPYHIGKRDWFGAHGRTIKVEE